MNREHRHPPVFVVFEPTPAACLVNDQMKGLLLCGKPCFYLRRYLQSLVGCWRAVLGQETVLLCSDGKTFENTTTKDHREQEQPIVSRLLTPSSTFWNIPAFLTSQRALQTLSRQFRLAQLTRCCLDQGALRQSSSSIAHL